MLNVKKLLLHMLTPETIPLGTSELNHLASASATLYRVGKFGLLTITAKNTSANLAVGSDATLKIAGLPTLKVVSRGCGYSGSTCMVAAVGTTGTVTLRVMGALWVASYDVYVVIPVILE